MFICRRFKAACLLFVLAIVTGCANSTSSPPPVLPLTPTDSRLIFFRPSAFFSSGLDAYIAINGTNTCSLNNGSGFVKDVVPGSLVILAYADSFGPISGSSKLAFTANAGQTYYVEFKPNVGSLFAPSLLVELSSGQQTGPFNMSLAGPGDMGGIVPVGCAN